MKEAQSASRGSMRDSDHLRLIGAASIIGGLLFTLATVLHSLQPVGCIAAECDVRPMRQGSALGGILTLVALLLILAGLSGLVVLARRAGRFNKLGKTGVILGAAGLAVVILAMLVQALFFNGDFPLMPFFLIPAGLAIITGFFLVGIVVLRSGVLPRWAGVLLIVSTALLLVFNEQTMAVLLAVPFGLSWVVVGYLLWSRTVQKQHPGVAGAHA